ncbi:MAG: fimbrial biogenesis chaperone [Pseudoalteromonas prydzensis]|uniref:fimbrial biogenesis chaperone n=1 Tax=Pseudoalteromonas TaxID=53246 RepID=UPI0039FCA30D
MFNKLTVMCVLLTAFFSQMALANLLISPTRVTFDERQRSAKVTVINNSDEQRTYRVIWSEKQALSGGGYNNLAQVTANSLSPMTRLSPKQVTLAPGEKQTVKIAIRKPKGLQPGEYRSHLLFQALPNENKEQKSGIQINMIMSFSIPVIYREQPEQPKVTITQANIIKNANQTKPQIQVQLQRHNNFSSYGKLSAYIKTASGEQEKIAEISNLSVYPEVDTVTATLSLFKDKQLPKNAELLLDYQGTAEYKAIDFASYTLAIGE